MDQVGSRDFWRGSVGTWLSLPSVDLAELLSSMEFSWLTIDLEHSGISIETAMDMMRVISLSGKAPLVRISSLDPSVVKRLMDSGAAGIIVPDVRSWKECKLAVDSVFYKPKGIRGVGLNRAQKYGKGFEEYKDWLNSNGPAVIVQIEDISAIPCLDEIFAVEEVTGAMIGPFDLTASLGVHGDISAPEYLEALDAIVEVAGRRDMPLGIHIVDPDPCLALQYCKQGFDFVAYGVDFTFVIEGAKTLSQLLSKGDS